jgi:hypothetical protein
LCLLWKPLKKGRGPWSVIQILWSRGSWSVLVCKCYGEAVFQISNSLVPGYGSGSGAPGSKPIIKVRKIINSIPLEASAGLARKYSADPTLLLRPICNSILLRWIHSSVRLRGIATSRKPRQVVGCGYLPSIWDPSSQKVATWSKHRPLASVPLWLRWWWGQRILLILKVTTKNWYQQLPVVQC